LLRKIHEAKENGDDQVVVWGTGTPRREFLHADDCAGACCFLMQNYNETGLINIGVGEDISIAELAGIIKNIVGFKGTIIYDTTKPDGTPRKLMDISKLQALGWKASISLTEGIKNVYQNQFFAKEVM
jgi:GDP-L-fucose synthase